MTLRILLCGHWEKYNELKCAHVPIVCGYYINKGNERNELATLEIVMERLGDRTLEEAARGSLTLQAKFRIVREVVKGMKFMHKLGHWHEFLRPSAIFVDKGCNVKIAGLELKGWEDGFQKIEKFDEQFDDPVKKTTEKYEGEVDVYSVGQIIESLFNKGAGENRPVLFKKLIAKCKSKRLFRITMVDLCNLLDGVHQLLEDKFGFEGLELSDERCNADIQEIFVNL